MQEVVGEAILPNTFSKTAQLSFLKLFSKKTALLVKLSCAKQARQIVRPH